MERKLRRSWQKKAAAAALALLSTGWAGGIYAAPAPDALPELDEIATGAVSKMVSRQGKTMTIQQSIDKLVLDWKSFNIGQDAAVNFNQKADWAALNRIHDANASEIYGHLTAGGTIFLINNNGILFGDTAQVDVGGIVASTMNMDEDNFKKGLYEFTAGANTAARVINEGKIHVGKTVDQIKTEGGLVALLAPDVENSGTITNNGGQTVLAAAKNVKISYDTAGKIGLQADEGIANASVLNAGTIQSDGGYIVMTARDASSLLNTVVKNAGKLEAKSMWVNDKGEIIMDTKDQKDTEKTGTISLDGGSKGVVEMGGTIDASGTSAGQNGGTINAKGQYLSVAGSINAAGDKAGGTLNTIAENMLVANTASIDLSGKNKAGNWKVTVKSDVTVKDADAVYKELQAAKSVSENAQKDAAVAAENAVAKKAAADAAKSRLETAQKTLEELSEKVKSKNSKMLKT